ncbi:Histidine protein methyltransferase 1 [Elasticomyces elasticus]|nr:Histidine protein methyltransferase 1 [Elasticomyces elasticus]
MSFSFNFSGDDIDAENGVKTADGAGPGSSAASQVEVVSHSLAELLATLPSSISYSTVTVESPTSRVLHLPRRELFDIRVQLMAEDDTSNESTLQDLEKSDIRSNVYEGGFKTWECSMDLASLLLDRGPRKDIDELCKCDNIIEVSSHYRERLTLLTKMKLGAGTALPTLVLFQHALQSSYSLTFTLADYNAAVLRLVTLPNLLLTWAKFATPSALTDSDKNAKGELEVTSQLTQRFVQDLQTAGIGLHFLSGPWSPKLADFISPSGTNMGTVILAAETIYSPASLAPFVDLVVDILKRVKMSKAMIGAKRMYFGVGGSVDALKEACAEKGAVCYEIENAGVPGMTAGVGRALLEVQMY